MMAFNAKLTFLVILFASLSACDIVASFSILLIYKEFRNSRSVVHIGTFLALRLYHVPIPCSFSIKVCGTNLGARDRLSYSRKVKKG